MHRHVKILAVLNIVWGSMGLLGALIILLIFGGAVGLIGMASHSAPAAHLAIPIVGIIGSIVFFLLLVTSIPAVIAGIALLKLAPWSRIFGIVISVLHLFNVPLGTALGIYGLWVLLSQETAVLCGPGRGPVHIDGAQGT